MSTPIPLLWLNTIIAHKLGITNVEIVKAGGDFCIEVEGCRTKQRFNLYVGKVTQHELMKYAQKNEIRTVEDFVGLHLELIDDYHLRAYGIKTWKIKGKQCT
jgi:hypothetical protein